MILLNLKNCIDKHYYNDKVEDDQPDVCKTPTQPNNKRKISFDSEELKIKKSSNVLSQINESFTPNAESTKIINNNSCNLEKENHEHTKIVEDLSLEDIDFEEPFTSMENKSDKTIHSENNVESKDNDEYCKKLMNVGKTIPLQSIQPDNTNVKNFNAENISISQWSKGDVVLNGKQLEVFFIIFKNI